MIFKLRALSLLAKHWAVRRSVSISLSSQFTVSTFLQTSQSTALSYINPRSSHPFSKEAISNQISYHVLSPGEKALEANVIKKMVVKKSMPTFYRV